MNDGLKTVTYQAKLGTHRRQGRARRRAGRGDRARRSASIRRWRAAPRELSKADLQSRLVNEFPELQGIAGRYYAAVERRAARGRRTRSTRPTCRVSPAMRSRRRQLGQVLAIAERLDTLAGGFAAGLKPTGNKDPFALRRNALGLARTIIEGGLDLDLGTLLAMALASQPTARCRLQAWTQPPRRMARCEVAVRSLRCRRACTTSSSTACAATTPTAACRRSSSMPSQQVAPAIAARLRPPPQGHRRVRQAARSRGTGRGQQAHPQHPAQGRGRRSVDAIDPALFTEPAERELHEAVEQAIADTDRRSRSATTSPCSAASRGCARRSMRSSTA